MSKLHRLPDCIISARILLVPLFNDMSLKVQMQEQYMRATWLHSTGLLCHSWCPVPCRFKRKLRCISSIRSSPDYAMCVRTQLDPLSTKSTPIVQMQGKASLHELYAGFSIT